MKSKAYLKGKEIRRKGYSIHYNPYRHIGSSKEFCDFEKGWKDEDKRSKK